MAKKKDTVKSLFTYIPVATLAIGLIASIVKFQAQAETTKAKVDDLAKDVKEISSEGDKEIKEIKAENKDLERKMEVNKTQQDNIQAQVQQVSEKTDKIYDVLLELKAKKK